MTMNKIIWTGRNPEEVVDYCGRENVEIANRCLGFPNKEDEWKNNQLYLKVDGEDFK